MTLYLDQVSAILAKSMNQYQDSLPIEQIQRHLVKMGGSPLSLCQQEIERATIIQNILVSSLGQQSFKTIGKKLEMTANLANIALRKIKTYVNIDEENRPPFGRGNDNDTPIDIADAYADLAYELIDLFPEKMGLLFRHFGLGQFINEMKRLTDIEKQLDDIITPIIKFQLHIYYETNQGEIPKSLENIDDYTYKHLNKTLRAISIREGTQAFTTYKRYKPNMKYQDYNFFKSGTTEVDYRTGHYTNYNCKNINMSFTGYFDPEISNKHSLDLPDRRYEVARDYDLRKPPTYASGFHINNKRITKAYLQSYLRKNNIKYTTKHSRKDLFKLCLSF